MDPQGQDCTRSPKQLSPSSAPLYIRSSRNAACCISKTASAPVVRSPLPRAPLPVLHPAAGSLHAPVLSVGLSPGPTASQSVTPPSFPSCWLSPPAPPPPEACRLGDVSRLREEYAGFWGRQPALQSPAAAPTGLPHSHQRRQTQEPRLQSRRVSWLVGSTQHKGNLRATVRR